jgi:hypothetical protein
VSLFREAAKQGVIQAQYNLGIMYENGLGVEQNFEQAIYWLLQAANQGSMDALMRSIRLNDFVEYIDGMESVLVMRVGETNLAWDTYSQRFRVVMEDLIPDNPTLVFEPDRDIPTRPIRVVIEIDEQNTFSLENPADIGEVLLLLMTTQIPSSGQVEVILALTVIGEAERRIGLSEYEIITGLGCKVTFVRSVMHQVDARHIEELTTATTIAIAVLGGTAEAIILGEQYVVETVEAVINILRN